MHDWKMSLLLVVSCLGLIVFPPHVANGHGEHPMILKPQNSSDVTPQRRSGVEIMMGIVVIGNVIQTILESLWTKRGVEIEISNQLTTSLDVPAWYMAHGMVSTLPPLLIEKGEPSTKIMFVANGKPFGTEGAMSYQITNGQKTHSLVVMWKVPRFMQLKFYISIKDHILNAKELETLFKTTSYVPGQSWIEPTNLHQYKTDVQHGITWLAAMGTNLAKADLKISLKGQ